MRYSVPHYCYFTDDGYNLGDQIQSIAVKNLLKKQGITAAKIRSHNRDELAKVESEETDILVVQGWFGCKEGTAQLPVNQTLTPLFFGFHLNEGSWEYLRKAEDFIKAMKNAEPIGCRDYGTRDFLRSVGVTSYYSGCLTLTFDRRESSPTTEKVFIIDPLTGIDPFIPFEEEHLVRLSQVGSFPSGCKPPTVTECRQLEFAARKRLNLLREKATLVVTKRLHVALPALAMGIPVVFLFNDPEHPRIAMLSEILPIYPESRFAEIDWAPDVVDLTKTKQKMKLLFSYRLETLEKKVRVQHSRPRLTKAETAEAKKQISTLCQEPKMNSTIERFYRKSFIAEAFSTKQLNLYRSGAPLLLWGAGSAGKRIHNILQYFGITVTAFSDSSFRGEKEGNYKGTTIFAPEKIISRYGKENVLIYIATLNSYAEVKKQLLTLGFPTSSIVGSSNQIRLFAHFVVPTSTSSFPPERVL